MLEKSFGLFFFLKQSKSSKKETERYVYCRITVDGIPKEVSLKRTWSPSKWNAATGRATGVKEDSKVLNAYLDSIISKVHQFKVVLLEQNKRITAQHLKELLTDSSSLNRLLLEIFDHHNKQILALVEKGDFAIRTWKRYNTTLSHTKAFIKWKYGNDDIDVRELDYEFAHDFSFWLKTIKSCAPSICNWR